MGEVRRKWDAASDVDYGDIRAAESKPSDENSGFR